ncbi:hypothetical protein ISF_00347 [Cordyceps fumosorosea ARSEF 2679]|uniref:F-box domain-containing protein n=1 Tax=Cordyceps fumosorosea (strain ARSEF 2679) TaxID=1081104 RepID=A0A168E6U5_CORFA|nr:hypothetical protein ISF_00347 [Cordyceps fumosorosea ARSEF 2679]OAA73446.1 hypothetical protein ISF_00347 [Cordyceps fumosorosea ARSEF 2679]
MIALPSPPGAHKYRRSNASAADYPSPESVHDTYQRHQSYQHSPPPHYQHQQPQQYQQHSPHQYHHQAPQQYHQQHHTSHSRQHSRQHSQHVASPPLRQSQQYHLPSPQSPSTSAMPSGIERLPNAVKSKVYGDLDYQSLIQLSGTNRYFNRTVDPQNMADPADKAQFVMRAAKDFPQHRPSEKGHDYKPGNFECYVCFRVRSPEHFDMLQPQHAYVDAHGHLVTDRDPQPGRDRQISLRRFCIECGVREGLHAPFDCLTTRTGRDLWVCKCRRIWAKPGCLRCPDCRADCPLRPKKKYGF